MSLHRSPTWVNIPRISISQLMQENVSNTPPDKIIYEEALSGRTVCYGAFHRQIRRTAFSLREIGFQPGQTLSISAASCIDYILVAQAVWWAGGVISPINNALHPDELRSAIDLIKPDYLVVDETLDTKLPTALNGSTHVKTTGDLPILSISRQQNPKYPRFPINHSPSLENEPELPTPIPLSTPPETTCAAILLSSGTTGRAKAVMLSHHNLVAACYQLRSDNPENWRGSQREVFFPPLSHVYALYVCFTMCTWLGAYVCLMPRFELELFCRLMAERQATVARIVPPVAKLLGEEDVVRRFRYSLEYFSCSAAALHDQTAKKLREAFPGVVLCQTYGCTELSGPCVQSGVRDRDTLPKSATGTLISNSELRFLDPDGNDAGPNQPGEIICRGPNVMMGYKDNPTETANTIMKDGWLRTGDIGYIDATNYLHIFDRVKDLIKYKGFQVAPSELENIIIRHPLVREAAVVATWSEREATELPLAFVVLDRVVGDTGRLREVREDIGAFVASRVSSYKRLRGGVVVLDALPKNTTGKVLKKELKERKVDLGDALSARARL